MERGGESLPFAVYVPDNTGKTSLSLTHSKTMFGSFNERSLALYDELVRAEYKEKAASFSGQGSEYLDNLGVGNHDKSFIEEGSQDPDDYKGVTGKIRKSLKQKGVIDHSEAEEWGSYDFAQCLRDDGTIYGSRGKCKKGKAISASAVARLKEERKSPEQKRREDIQKRGVKAVTRAKAEKVLEDLQKEGARDKKASERRAKTGRGEDREEQVRQVRAKAFLAMEKLKAKTKKMVPGPQKQKVEARIARLKEILGRLDKAQQKARDAKPKMGDGMGTLPSWAGTGKQLLG